MEAANAIRDTAMAHMDLAEEKSLSWKRYEDEVRRIVTDYVGVRRNEKGLRLALDTLRALAKREPELRADDLHGLMRVHESTSIRLSAELMAAAALARQETRTGSSHRRIDYPNTDDENWRKFVIVQKGADGPDVSTLAASEPLAAAFSRKDATGTGEKGLSNVV